MKIKIKKIYDDAIIPKAQRAGDADLDIYSYEDKVLKAGGETCF
jgi:hypothetical protein